MKREVLGNSAHKDDSDLDYFSVKIGCDCEYPEGPRYWLTLIFSSFNVTQWGTAMKFVTYHETSNTINGRQKSTLKGKVC